MIIRCNDKKTHTKRQSYKQHPNGLRMFNTKMMHYHLKATWVSKQPPRPIHKFMEPSQLINELRSGTEGQVIGVSKNYLASNVLKLTGRQTFYCTCKDHESNVSYYSSEDIQCTKIESIIRTRKRKYICAVNIIYWTISLWNRTLISWY